MLSAMHSYSLEKPPFSAAWKITISYVQPLPKELLNLYSNDELTANDFKKNIRQNNWLFQMTSFGAIEGLPMRNKWNPMIIQGQFHHYIEQLMPDPNQQIYFMDPQDSLELRVDVFLNDGIQQEIVELLEKLLQQNPYIESLQPAKEQIWDMPQVSIVIDPDQRPTFEHKI